MRSIGPFFEKDLWNDRLLNLARCLTLKHLFMCLDMISFPKPKPIKNDVCLRDVCFNLDPLLSPAYGMPS